MKQSGEYEKEERDGRAARASGAEAECHIEMFIGAGRAAQFGSANVSKIL